MFRQTVTGIETQLGPQVNLADKFELNQELAVIEVETARKASEMPIALET